MFYLTTNSTHFSTVIWKEIFYLTMHSAYFSTVMWKEKEGNVLFNDALDTF